MSLQAISEDRERRYRDLLAHAERDGAAALERARVVGEEAREHMADRQAARRHAAFLQRLHERRLSTTRTGGTTTCP
jgi:hypothetical protein